MKRLIKPFVLLGASLICLTSCVAITVVKPVHNLAKAHGQEYSLPATFLLVQPQADGTATYSWIYLPDKSKTYTIKQYAILSKFTLDTTISNGLLSKVVDSSDNSAVSAKLLDDAQQVYSARRTAVGTADKTNATKIATAQAAVVTAQTAYAQAQQDLSSLQKLADGDALKTPAAVFAAQQKVNDTKIALDAANVTLAQLQVAAAGDAPITASSGKQFGPVLFRVMQDDKGGVQLVAVNDQDTYDAPNFASQTSAQAPAQVTLTASPSALSGSNPTLTITSSQAIGSVNQSLSLLSQNLIPLQNSAFKLTLKDPKTLTVAFPNGLHAGSYSIVVCLTPTGSDTPTTQAVSFTVNGN